MDENNQYETLIQNVLNEADEALRDQHRIKSTAELSAIYVSGIAGAAIAGAGAAGVGALGAGAIGGLFMPAGIFLGPALLLGKHFFDKAKKQSKAKI